MNFMTAPFSKGNIVNQTGASYTVLPGDGLIRCDSTSNNITLTLPAATGSGREITVKSVAISNNSITITSSGSTFDGQSSMTFISDGYGERTLLDVATNIWNVTSRTFDGYGGDLVLSAKTNRGIRINPSSPVYGWKDLLGSIQARTTGAATIMPFAAYQSGIYQYQMDTVNREAHNEFHLPHDYLPGSDIYIHVHWSLAAAGGTGSATFTFDLMYAKGYNQAAFPAAVTTTVTQAASGTAYQHMIAEVIASSAGGSGTTLNSSLFEVDGLILVRTRCTTLPTGTGGAPFIHYIDIHYQSTQLATLGRNVPFYS